MKSLDALIINCNFQKNMDYRSIPICSRHQRSNIKDGELNTALENSSEKQSSLSINNPKTAFWSSSQKKCSIMYWIRRFLQDPLEVCSFDAPLARKGHFQDMSDFMRNELGEQLAKTPDQCKTSFSVIKRKVLRQRRNGSRSQDYDLYDYVLEEGRRLARTCANTQERTWLLQALRRLEDMGCQEGEFMALQKSICQFELGCAAELKNNEIYKYFKETRPSDLPPL